MANSLITRCPKCSTAFRVSDDVLSMAKGKVRCGQCFHIFNANESANSKTQTTNKERPSQENTQTHQEKTPLETSVQTNTTSKPLFSIEAEFSTETRLAPTEEIVNPDWLHTLFDDNDLHPIEETSFSKLDTTQPKPAQRQAEPKKATTPASKASIVDEKRQDEPAPWEVELAEVEAALKATSKTGTVTKPAPSATTTPSHNENQTVALSKEPDYMVALHSLAQTAAEQARPSDIKNQHSILEQLSAQQSLAPLMGENGTTSRKSNSHPWLWFFASLLGIALLTAQVATHFFDEGSRSSSFRSIYRTICSYSGCVLPRFEDISAITIQHVRIQSHPSIPNTLLVNAIITNTSDFSQPMPKIALEFFDLNGLPVAARLFSPSDYLHKDFLDITYMPPNTPIHLVIPIQDPGARAVTHQIRAFPTDTRSY